MQAPTRSYDDVVFDFVHSQGSNTEPLVFAEFKKLQRLNLVELQIELASLKGDIQTAEKVSPSQRAELRRVLSEYSKFRIYQNAASRN